MKFVGKSLLRVDISDKIKGRGIYSDDIETDNMLYAGVFRSTVQHALIKKVDVSKAENIPGIVKILTCNDIPGENSFGTIIKDQPFLAEDKVRFKGEAIALIVADSPEIIPDACKKIEVDYLPLTIIDSPEKADRLESEIKIHENGNLLAFKKVIKGDISDALNNSHVVVENNYETSFLDHMFMEPESGIGFYNENDDTLKIISSTQNIHYKQNEIARLLSLDKDKIKIVQAVTGGGFGGKLDVTVEGWIALAVYHTGKPVKLTLTRDESFLTNTKRHALKFNYITCADRHGKITGVKVKIIGDTGAYASYGSTVCLRSAVHCTGPYYVPNVFAESYMYYTNNHPCGAMRGFGIPQTAFAHESQMDMVAEALNIDPFEIRLKNILKAGDTTATGQKLKQSVGIEKTLLKVEPFYKNLKEKNEKGIGIGCMYYGIGNTGIPNPSTMEAELTENGKIIIHSGVCEIGQGSDTVLFQIALETLSVDKSCISFSPKDTSITYDAGSTSASRQTYISGKALYEACLKMKKFLEQNGFYSGKNSLTDIYKKTGNVKFKGYFDPPTKSLDPETSQGIPYATYAFATHLVHVSTDKTTGFTEVKKVWAAHDVGKAVNPVLLKGQVNSGVAMGIGMALMEKFENNKTENLHKYYIPTSMDIPEVESFFIEEEESTGPYGAKGIGEPALIPTAPAIINGIADFLGLRITKIPADIEEVKTTIEKYEKGGKIICCHSD